MSGSKWVVRRGRSSLRWMAGPDGWWWRGGIGARYFGTHAEALAYAIQQAEAGR